MDRDFEELDEVMIDLLTGIDFDILYYAIVDRHHRPEDDAARSPLDLPTSELTDRTQQATALPFKYNHKHKLFLLEERRSGVLFDFRVALNRYAIEPIFGIRIASGYAGDPLHVFANKVSKKKGIPPRDPPYPRVSYSDIDDCFVSLQEVASLYKTVVKTVESASISWKKRIPPHAS